MSLDDLLARIRDCRLCAAHLPLGPRPVLVARPTARLLIVGQAPGTRVHESGIPWNDRSGDRLRGWLGVDRTTFYDPDRIAVMPMGFCYPGVLANGGDAPPRPECAPLWHDPVLQRLPETQRRVLELRMGLVDGHPQDPADAARTLGISLGELREIEARAFERIREVIPLQQLQRFLER